MDEDRSWAPAMLASDYDGCRHLVALTDDVADWVVTVTLADGTTRVVEPEPATGFYYYPALGDRVCWFIDFGEHWDLHIAGRRITSFRGDRAGNVPEEEHR